MLSIIMVTVIMAVALPSLRLTTLSMIRSTATTYVLLAYLVMLSGTMGTLDLFHGIVTVDATTLYLVLVSILLVYAVQAYSTSVIATINGTPYTVAIFVCIFLIGTFYLVSAGDIVTAAIALEVQSFSVYAITAVYRWREGATSAGLIYFMLGALSSGLILLGFSMMYAYTAETNLTVLLALDAIGTDSLITVALTVLVAGLLFKVTAAPFHYWGPDVYDRVPTIVTLFISIMPKVGIIALLTRLSGMVVLSDATGMLVMTVVLSWAVGSVIGLVQTRFKRIIAYSTIGHVGWMLIAIVLGSTIGFGSLMFYLLQYSATSALTFLCVIGIGYAFVTVYDYTGKDPYATSAGHRSKTNYPDIESLEAMDGLYYRSALLTLMLGVTLFSAAGIPPIVGFYAKLSVLQSILYNGYTLLTVLGVLSSVVSAGFYLSVISAMVFKPSLGTPLPSTNYTRLNLCQPSFSLCLSCRLSPPFWWCLTTL